MRRLSSPYLALLFFPLTALGSLAAANGLATPTALLALPFFVLAVNLGAAIAVNARFRTDGWLLLFHLALLALVLLLVLARLTHFEGKAPITRGGVFDGYIEFPSIGFLHGERYRRLLFSNAGFTERSENGPYGGGIVNRVRWQGQARDGIWSEGKITNDAPLDLDGYRIYPTTSLGFAPMLVWEPSTGPPIVGAIQLPPPTSADFQRGAAWRIDHGPELWAWIGTSPAPTDADRENLGADTFAHVLVIRSGERRFELRLGDVVELSGGRLRYVKLETWIGYHIIYDPTRPWLVATILVAVTCLLAYYLRRLGCTSVASLE